MRIVHVITRLLNAGSEENTLASALHQAAAGHEVWIVHGNEFNPAWYDKLSSKITLVEVGDMVHPIRPSRDWAAGRALRRLYREVRADVVHTHQSKAGILGRLAAIGLPTAVIHTVHIAPFLNVSLAAKAVYVAIEAGCALVTDRIISVSEGMRDACLSHFVGRRSQHVVVHSGMAIDTFQTAVAPDEWRGRIGGWARPARPRIALMLAAFEPRKRQEPWLEAMALHLRADPDLCILFAGAGDRLEATRQRVQALGVADQVRFLGHDPHPETLIALADVCVLTSEREGLPRVVVQYLAAGKPVVLTDLPGIREIVTPDRNGLIVGENDLNAAASAVAGLLSDPDQLARLSAGARATDVSPWAQVRMGEAIQAVYDEAVAVRARRGATW